MAAVLAGRDEEAHAPVQHLLRLEPGFTVQRFRERFPGSAWPLCDLCCNALGRAGIPLAG